MKKYLTLLVLLFTMLTATAQNEDAYYLYQDGNIADIFYPSDTRSMSIKPLDGTEPQQYEVLFKQRRNGVRFPVATVDSISFLQPPLSTFRKEGRVNHITYNAFRKLVIDCAAKPEERVFLSDRPVIVDCWAKWCGYCIEMMPTMEQLAQEYKGRIDFYKVDVDEELLLSDYLASYSLPCLYFFPKQGQPMSHEGLMNASSIREIIENFLLVTDDEDPNAEKPAVELNLWKGDVHHSWTDRRFTAQVKCTSKNATLVKYGCFLKSDIENSSLSERELIQRYGNVLEEKYLPRVNSKDGMPITFRAEKQSTYLFLCLVKTAQGGVTVESSEITTDADFVPLMDFQVQIGALAENLQPQKNHFTIYMKTLEAAEAAFGCMLKDEYYKALADGETIETLLAGEGERIYRLTEEQLARANAMGYNQVIAPLEELTDYVCFARVRNQQGQIMEDSEELKTPYAGYNEVILYPTLNVITGLIGNSVSCSVNCSSSDAIYTALLMLPSEEVTRFLAEGKTLEDLMETHPKVSVMSSQQLEWINGQGVSNVLSDVQPHTRYTCIADAYGRFGGRVVHRSDIQTLPQGMTASPLDVVLGASFSQKMLTASAVCRSANAVSATGALIESDKLEKILASGVQLEELMEQEHADFLQYQKYTGDQLTWFNQSGFVMAYSNSQPSTRYTWLLDTRNAAGDRQVQRSEVLTPNQYEMNYLTNALAPTMRAITTKAMPLQQVMSIGQ